MKNRGFTLLELLIVLVIIGIGAAFIAPTVARSLTNLKLKTATKQLAAVLRYARSKAVSSKNTTQVIIDIDNARYSAEISQDKSSTENTGTSAAFPSSVRFKQVKLGEEIHESGLVQLLFYPKGNTSGGEIILENDRYRQYRITIDNLTGKVKINRLSEGEGWG
jgi:general secretion pathway protein H